MANHRQTAPNQRAPGARLSLPVDLTSLRALLDGFADGVIVLDAAGRCLAGNRAAEALLGYRDGEWLTLELSHVAIGVADGLCQVRRKDGAQVVVESWATEIVGLGGAAALVFLREARDLHGFDTGADGPGPGDFMGAKAIIAVSLDGMITGWNQTAERLYGFSASEVIGRSIAKLAPTESIDEAAPLLERNEQELRQARASAKDANRVLRESEERFRGAFDGASIGMALVSPDGRFLLVNPSLRGILGYHGNELLARTFDDVTHPDDLDSDRELARQLLGGEIDSYQIEKRYLRKNGEAIWGRLTVSLARDGAEIPSYFVAQVQDVTPYKAAGAALREAEARYRTLVEQIPAAVYVDAGESLGTPRYISPRIEALLGYSPREWVADPDLWIREIHPEDRERIVAAIAAADGVEEPMHLEYRFLARDGREVWVHDQVALVRDEHGAGQYWQGFMVDITDRKRAEEELRLAKEAAEEANRLKSAFLSMATHELRTPLTIISGYVELLAESSPSHLTPEEREYLDIAQTGARTLAALVDDLLDLARMEAGRLDLTIRPVKVDEAIERVHRLVAAQAASKGIELEVTVTSGLPPVAADLNRLVQVLFNLLGNAIKFTEYGSVSTMVHAVGDGIEFRVVDTGIGIAPDALPRIFDEFRQADAGATRKFGGSGLGLAIAKRLVELQGGTISVESEAGVGSTFAVWLPSVETGSAEGRHPMHRLHDAAATGAGRC